MSRKRHRWGRSQKYHVRPRTIYALLFDSGYAYVGQSVNVVERERQHRRPRGGWIDRRFRVIRLEQRQCTEAQAVELEHAWRMKAARAGWGVYAKPPNVPCDPWRRATLRRRWLALWRHWPWRHRRDRWMWILVLGGVALLAGWPLLALLLA